MLTSRSLADQPACGDSGCDVGVALGVVVEDWLCAAASCYIRIAIDGLWLLSQDEPAADGGSHQEGDSDS